MTNESGRDSKAGQLAQQADLVGAVLGL